MCECPTVCVRVCVCLQENECRTSVFMSVLRISSLILMHEIAKGQRVSPQKNGKLSYLHTNIYVCKFESGKEKPDLIAINQAPNVAYD